MGDAQTQIEGPVKREQIFALITKVRRKEKWLEPGDFWWEFFEHVWLHMIPLRRGIMWCYEMYIRDSHSGKQSYPGVGITMSRCA